MTAFAFELVTPERVLWTGSAEEVSMRTDVGEVTFLANHASLVGALEITLLRIVPSGGSDDEVTGSGGDHAATSAAVQRAAVHGGFVHVDQNKVVIAAPVAELAEEIDVPRARRALAEAEARAGTEEVAAEAAAGDRGAFLDPASNAARLQRARIRLLAAGESVDIDLAAASGAGDAH
jgi:F-type H+-transporting ATPase subunit epsilon